MNNPQPATREQIRWLYRTLLNREAESADAVEQWFRRRRPFEAIREAFIESPEFANVLRHLSLGDAIAGLESYPPMEVEVSVESVVLNEMLEHIQVQWEQLGREEPHWSVLSDPRFLSASVRDYTEAFFESGRSEISLLEQALGRAGRSILRDATALELGCGIGRVTQWLAQIVGHIHAFDISRSHLDLAARHLKSYAIDNVTLHRLTAKDLLREAPPVDFFFSILVLQHNPPPVARELLQGSLAALRKNGLGYFQVPTYRPQYCFSARSYLQQLNHKSGIEMHAIPQAEVFDLCFSCNCKILDVWRDNYTQGTGLISHTLLVEKQ